jgi:uncharacterized protein
MVMKKSQQILDQYQKLTAYCDSFWNQTQKQFPDSLACHAGCSICCELTSVNYLEAMNIARYCESHNTSPINKTPDQTAEKQDGSCPFCADNRCRIYEARPLICRTHGLLLKSKEFTDRITITCPYNFSDVDLSTIDDASALDIDAVTNGLAKLNAAFCLLTGDIKKTEERVALVDLAGGRIGSAHFGIDTIDSRTNPGK